MMGASTSVKNAMVYSESLRVVIRGSMMFEDRSSVMGSNRRPYRFDETDVLERTNVEATVCLAGKVSNKGGIERSLPDRD